MNVDRARAGMLNLAHCQDPPMFSNILLAVDGSEASVQAARKGIALASCLNAKVTVVAVTVPWAEYFARELAVVVPDVVRARTRV